MNDYDVGKIFQEIELKLIGSMQRNLRGHELDELVEGFKWEQWQAKKIRELRKYRKQNLAIMQSYKSTLDRATKEDLRKQFLEGGSKVDAEVKQAIKGGYLTKRTPSDDFFQGNNKKLDSLIKSVNNDMATAQTAALRKMDDVYRQTIFKAEAFTAAGASTVKQAVDMATKDFLAKGINCITYKNGRKVNIASYARMAIRTANKRVHLMGEGERRKEWGESLVLVSQYLQCFPLCIPWQGKVYIDDVYSGGKASDGPYPLLSTAIAGDLFHPNCRHTMSTYFEGISDEPAPMSESEIGENYEQTQQDAYINRNIQKYTRLKEGSTDEGNIKKYDAKVKEWKQRKNMSMNDSIKWPNDGKLISKEQYKDLREYAEAKGINLSKFKDFNGDIDLIKEVIDDMSMIASEYPKLLDINKKLTLSLSKFMDDDDFAQARGHIISINAKAFRNKEKLSEEYSKLSNSGWFTQNTSYRAIIKHEMGHLVQDAYKIDSVSIGKEVTGTTSKDKLFKTLKGQLSEYSSKHIDGSEIVSEVFAEVYDSKNPRELSLKFKENIDMIIKRG